MPITARKDENPAHVKILNQSMKASMKIKKNQGVLEGSKHRCLIEGLPHLYKLLGQSVVNHDKDNLRVEVEVQLGGFGKATKSIRRFGGCWEIYQHDTFTEYKTLKGLLKNTNIGEALEKGALYFTGWFE